MVDYERLKLFIEDREHSLVLSDLDMYVRHMQRTNQANCHELLLGAYGADSLMAITGERFAEQNGYKCIGPIRPRLTAEWYAMALDVFVREHGAQFYAIPLDGGIERVFRFVGQWIARATPDTEFSAKGAEKVNTAISSAMNAGESGLVASDAPAFRLQRQYDPRYLDITVNGWTRGNVLLSHAPGHYYRSKRRYRAARIEGDLIRTVGTAAVCYSTDIWPRDVVRNAEGWSNAKIVWGLEGNGVEQWWMAVRVTWAILSYARGVEPPAHTNTRLICNQARIEVANIRKEMEKVSK